MKKLALLGAVAAVSATAFAEPIQWIGTGEVACWTNAANWVGGVVPGRYVDSNGNEAGAAGAEVEFVVGASDRTIDLDGLLSVANMSVSGTGGGRLLFGTSDAQTLTLEEGGAFTVAASVSKAPILVAGLGQYGTGGSATKSTFTNDSADPIVFQGGIGRKFGYTSWKGLVFTFAGTGGYRLAGPMPLDKSGTVCSMTHKHDGVFVVDHDANFHVMAINQAGTPCTIEVTEGHVCKLAGGSGNGLVAETYNKKQPIVTGAGTLLFPAGYVSGTTVYLNGLTRSGNNDGTPLLVSTAVVDGWSTTTSSNLDVGIRTTNGNANPGTWSTGILRMASPDCRLNGNIEIYSAMCIQADTFGLKGEKGSLGSCTNFYLCNRARLVHTGPADMTDRNFHIGRHEQAKASKAGVTFYTPNFSLEQAGTGPLTVNSTLDVVEDNLNGLVPTVTLINDTFQPATWAGNLAVEGLSVVKTGTGAWTLSGDNTYTGTTIVSNGTLVVSKATSLAASDVSLAGGKLEIPAVGEATTTGLKGLTASADSRLDVGLGNTLVFSSLSVASGKTLTIVTADDATLVKVAGQSAGEAPGVTLNGAPAHYNEQGELVGAGTAWNKSASGSWHDADNWTDGVPSSGKATRINVRGDFAVRVDAAAASGNLLVKNVSGRTTLAVSNDYPISAASVTLDKGAEMLVGKGGRATWSGLTGMTFREGGRLTVDGGTVEVSGATAVSDISSSDPENPSGITVKDGTFKYMVPSSTCPLTLGDGARLEVSGGTNVTAWSNWFCNLMKFSGGMTHVFSGDAAWLFSSTTCGGIYADGTFAFADNALMTCDFGSSYNLIFAPLTADGLCELSFSDHAKVDSNRILLYLGCPGSAMSATEAGTRVVFDSEATSTVGCIWAGIERTSVAEVVVKRGRVDVGSYGINLGTTWEGYYCKDSAARGVFKMQGGVLTVGGLGYKGYNSFLSGIGVGNGCNDGTKGNVPYHFSGRFELDGGAVTNTIGFLVVGAGRASGEFVQRGGVLCFDDTTNAKTFPCPQIIGAFTGDGLFAVSNGVARFEVGTPMYVGGLAKDDLRTAGYFTDYWPNVLPNLVTGDLAATGKVEVVDGELISAGDLILGADGRGEISIVGSKGAANFANAVFSNKVESVASFTLDANGVSPLALSGDLTVTDGAKLRVDVSQYVGTRAHVKLITCARKDGSFAKGNIEIVGREADERLKDAAVVQSATGVSVRFPRGAMLLIR